MLKKFRELNETQLGLDEDSATVECSTLPFEFKKLIQFFHSSPSFSYSHFSLLIISMCISYINTSNLLLENGCTPRRLE